MDEPYCEWTGVHDRECSTMSVGWQLGQEQKAKQFRPEHHGSLVTVERKGDGEDQSLGTKRVDAHKHMLGVVEKQN